jgi:hypothetical protein
MKNFLSGIMLFALVAGSADTQDKKDRGKTPELTKKYTDLMKANSKELKGILEDIEKNKPEADIKKRLAAIREQATKARELKYRKDEEEQEKLDAQFEIFLLKIRNDFEGVEWGDKEKRLYLAERVQAKCDVCHELHRDE